MELEDRVAEAIFYAQGYDDWEVANAEERSEAKDLARAAIRAMKEQ